MKPELPIEIWIKILLIVAQENCIQDEKRLSRPIANYYHPPFLNLRMVSKSWKFYLEFDGFWFELLREKSSFLALENIRDSYNNKSLDSFKLAEDFLSCVPAAAYNLDETETSARPSLFGLFKELCWLDSHLLFEYPLIERGLRASSTDHPTQSINSTRSLDPFEFWSSTGVSDQNSDEYLVYELQNNINLVHTILIKPFLAQYQKGLPCYAPQFVSFSIGFSEENYHYESSKYPILNKPILQKFKLPGMVCGSIVRINLHGRNQNQPGDLLFYTCLEEVQILGIPCCALKDTPLLLQSTIEFVKRTSNVTMVAPDILENNTYHVAKYLDDVSKAITSLQTLPSAIDYMSKAPLDSLLRNDPFLSLLRKEFEKNMPDYFPQKKHGNKLNFLDFTTWFRFYVTELFENEEGLTTDEALILAELSKADKDKLLIEQGINRGWICCTIELGSIFEDESQPEFLPLAYSIYLIGRSFDKILDISLKLKNYRVSAEVVYSTFTLREMVEWIPTAIITYTKQRMAEFVLLYVQFLELASDPAWSIQDLESEMRLAFEIQAIELSLKDALKSIVQNREIFNLRV